MLYLSTKLLLLSEYLYTSSPTRFENVEYQFPRWTIHPIRCQQDSESACNGSFN